MPALEFLPTNIFTLIAELVLFVLLLLFYRKLRGQQQRYIRLVHESSQELKEIQKRVKSFDRELLNLVEKKISETFDGIPSIGEQMGKEGQERLQRLLEWQEREIKREQEQFVATLKQSSLKSSQDFNNSLNRLAAQLQKVMSESVLQASKESNAALQSLQQEKISELAVKLEGMLAKMSQEILRKTIDPKTQEKLVMQALEEAWQEGVLSRDEKN